MMTNADSLVKKAYLRAAAEPDGILLIKSTAFRLLSAGALRLSCRMATG